MLRRRSQRRRLGLDRLVPAGNPVGGRPRSKLRKPSSTWRPSASCSNGSPRGKTSQTPSELEELWAIDNSAYGAASITYEKFRDWWRAYPPGFDGSELGPAHWWRNRLVASFRPYCGTPDKCPTKGIRFNGRDDAAVPRSTSSPLVRLRNCAAPGTRRGTRAIRVLLGDGLSHWIYTAA